jgi:hypothetical protein
MEAVMRIVRADVLEPFMKLPESMRHGQVRVFITPFEDGHEVSETKPRINREILRKFADPARHEEFIAGLRKKQAEGVQFDFDVQKLIDGTETDEDRQKRFRSEKGAWAKAVAKKYEGKNEG